MPNEYSKNIVYLSKAQYQELITNNSITVDGQTITYNDSDIYVTPQAEPVTDVQINGTSIATNGVANVPVATASESGVVQAPNYYGVEMNGTALRIFRALESDIKAGTHAYRPITPSLQQNSVFYALAKLAGADMASSSNPVGTYTDAAKQKIQNMLGITDLLSAEETATATTAHALNSLFLMNGKLYKATAAIAIGDAVVEGTNCEVVKIEDVFIKNTDYASTTTAGIAKIGDGLVMDTGTLKVAGASSATVKTSANSRYPIVPSRQHESVFYGLSKVAGVDLKDETVTVGTYPETSKTAIRSLIGAAAASDIPSVPVQDVQVNGTSVLSNGIANVPIASSSNVGAVKVGATMRIDASGNLNFRAVGAGEVKAGTSYERALSPERQHASVFYGLAKAAGEDMASSSNPIGTYTDAAKTAIRNMIGATSNKVIAIQDEQPTDTDTKIWLPGTQAAGVQVPTMEDMNTALAGKVNDVQINGTSIVQNNVANIPISSGSGLACDGINLKANTASDTSIKTGTSNSALLTPGRQHRAVFYGLAKAAGDTTQASSDNAVGTYTADASTAIRSMLSAVGTTDYATTTKCGIVKIGAGLETTSNGALYTYRARSNQIKAGIAENDIISPYNQHEAAFYGLAKAAGDTTMASSSNAVGTYTAEAKSAIQSMLGVESGVSFVENISGTTPTIIGEANTRYMCGELSLLDITPPSIGTIDIVFSSGTTPTVLTLPSNSTIKWPKWFDPTALESDMTYEINIMDNMYGAVMAW